MNEHVSGLVFKDKLDASIPRQAEPSRKPQRRPLGLAPAADEGSIPSVLDAVPEEVLDSPASVRNVLEALDSAVSIRTDIDQPLKVRIGHLENSERELKAELEASKAEQAALKASLASLQSNVTSLLEYREANRKADAKAEARARLDAKLARIVAKRAELKVVK